MEQPLPLLTDDVTADDKVVEDCQNWLSFHQVWGQLPVEALQAIAQSSPSLDIITSTSWGINKAGSKGGEKLPLSLLPLRNAII
ncbi:hypothetical protein [Nostoc sp.]|uniref:hypothetical protein n=1 Tax=Nostoc sp. TaxID=1180 RepID=UPI002FF4B52F